MLCNPSIDKKWSTFDDTYIYANNVVLGLKFGRNIKSFMADRLAVWKELGVLWTLVVSHARFSVERNPAPFRLKELLLSLLKNGRLCSHRALDCDGCWPRCGLHWPSKDVIDQRELEHLFSQSLVFSHSPQTIECGLQLPNLWSAPYSKVSLELTVWMEYLSDEIPCCSILRVFFW